MQVSKLILSVIIIFSISNITNAQEGFPINFNGKTLSRINNSKAWDGKIIAFDSEIIEIQKAYVGKPYYQVKLDDGQKIWIASLINTGFEKVGVKLRILGYFATVQDDDSISKKFNSDGFHILAFGILNLTTKEFSMLPDGEIQAKEWMNGKIPE